MKTQVKREIWIDNIKVIACILVLLGHLIQSLVKSNILTESSAYLYFNTTIYYFHVPIFFICSGYLYQKYSHVNSIKQWYSNILSKAISLGIPYFTFLSVTYILKKLFESSTNSHDGNYLNALLLRPINQYWYFYVLFLLFLITPTIATKKSLYISFLVSLLCKLLYIFLLTPVHFPLFIGGILDNEIWFMLGIVMACTNFQKKINIKLSYGLFCLFIVLSILYFNSSNNITGVPFALGVIACLSLFGIMYNHFCSGSQTTFFRLLAPYTFPIYVMHTIFAAGYRACLLHIGITSFIIHFIGGLIVSIIFPIIAAFIMSKCKYLNFFLYPQLLIKRKTYSNHSSSIIVN